MIEDYLGDGVYAVWDGETIWLDVRGQNNVMTIGPNGQPGIALDLAVLKALDRFRERIKEAA